MPAHAPDHTTRVVIENADPAAAHAQAAALTAAGYVTTVCAGPASLPGGVCPAVDGTGCALLDDADVVVHDLDLNVPANRDVLTRLRHGYPDLAVVLEVSEDDARGHASLLHGCHVIPPLDMDNLVHAVGAAAAASVPSASALTAPDD